MSVLATVSSDPDDPVGVLVDQALELIPLWDFHPVTPLGHWIRGLPHHSVSTIPPPGDDPDVHLLYWLEHTYEGSSLSRHRVLTVPHRYRAEFLTRLRVAAALLVKMP